MNETMLDVGEPDADRLLCTIKKRAFSHSLSSQERRAGQGYFANSDIECSKIELAFRATVKNTVFAFLDSVSRGNADREKVAAFLKELESLKEHGWDALFHESTLGSTPIEQYQKADAQSSEKEFQLMSIHRGVTSIIKMSKQAMTDILLATKIEACESVRLHDNGVRMDFYTSHTLPTLQSHLEVHEWTGNPNPDIRVFKNLLREADIMDSTYPLSALVWLPNGTKILEYFNQIFRSILSNNGFGEYIFPNLVPATEFDRINRGIYSFENAIYRPTSGTVLRPSGEAAMYPMFKKWIRTKEDLPLKTFQIASMFRNVRGAGIFKPNESNHFVEGHTAHSTREEALVQLDENNKINTELLNAMAVPFIQSRRPSLTNRPVAEIHVGFDTILPSGETVLVACAYGQMQIFSKLFGVIFSEKGKKEYTYQTELGFSQKVALASMWLTSDEKGLCLLPEIAPIQATIMLLSDEDCITARGRQLQDMLQRMGIRTNINTNSNKNLRKRHENLEKHGIPLRIELGSHEYKEGIIIVSRRDTSQKTKFGLEEVEIALPKMLNEISQNLRRRTISFHHSHLRIATSFEEMAQAMKERKVAKAGLCATEACIRACEESIGNGEILGFCEENTCRCLHCYSETTTVGYYARRI